MISPPLRHVVENFFVAQIIFDAENFFKPILSCQRYRKKIIRTKGFFPNCAEYAKKFL